MTARGCTLEGDGVHTFDVASGRQLRSAPSSGGMALSPDGSTLAVVRTRQIALLDPERLTVKSVIEEDGAVDGLMFSPKGEHLGYEVSNGLVVRALADPDDAGVHLSGLGGRLDGIGFSPDGRTLYSRGDDRLWVWDLVGDRRFVRSLHVQPQPDSTEIGLAMVSPDGQTVGNLLDGGDEAFGVQLLDVKSGTRMPQSALRSSNAYFADLAWRPDSAVVASTQNDQWVDLWDGVTGQAAGRHRVPDRYGVAETVRFSGDNARLVVGTHQGWVYAVDATTLKVVGKPVQVKAGVPMRFLAANGDGARALVWIDRKLQLLDLMHGRVLKTADPGFYAESWAWTPDGKAIVVVGSMPNPGRLRHGRNPGSGRPVDEVQADPGHTFPGDRSSSPPMAQRFATSGDDRVGLWDVPSRGSAGLGRRRERQPGRVRPRHLRGAHRLAGREGLGLGPAARDCSQGRLPDRRPGPDRGEWAPTSPARTPEGLRFLSREP